VNGERRKIDLSQYYQVMKKKIVQVTEDYSRIEKELSPENIISNIVQRALKPKSKGRKKPMAPDERVKRARDLERGRKAKSIAAGICPRCKKNPHVEGRRMCLRCQERGRKYVKKSSLKKREGFDW
jgi:hypothetical protein